MGYFILERKHGKVQIVLVAFPHFTTGVAPSNKVFRNSVKAARFCPEHSPPVTSQLNKPIYKTKQEQQETEP